MYGGDFDDGTEGFIVVKAGLLREATQDSPSFVTSKRAVGVVFVVIDPFAGNNVGTRRGGDQIPCVVCREGRELLYHSCTPVWIAESSSVRSG